MVKRSLLVQLNDKIGARLRIHTGRRILAVHGLATAIPCWLVADEKQLPIQRLDGVTRAKVLAALAGLIIVALALVAFIWLAARVARRYMKRATNDPAPSKYASQTDDWAQKPITGDDGLPDDRDR
jgi:hypothetical protein